MPRALVVRLAAYPVLVAWSAAIRVVRHAPDAVQLPTSKASQCRGTRVGDGRGSRFVSNEEIDSHLEADISVHILSVSAAMVGVCLTVIGLLRVVITIRKADTYADDLLAVDSVLFLMSALLSYWALRTRTLRRMHRVERYADAIFLLALMLMVVVCGFVTWALI
jgi:hypothetical protein